MLLETMELESAFLLTGATTWSGEARDLTLRTLTSELCLPEWQWVMMQTLPHKAGGYAFGVSRPMLLFRTREKRILPSV